MLTVDQLKIEVDHLLTIALMEQILYCAIQCKKQTKNCSILTSSINNSQHVFYINELIKFYFHAQGTAFYHENTI